MSLLNMGDRNSTHMAQKYLELDLIDEKQPAGLDVRYDPEFEELQAEIDKMSLPSATSGVDWSKVRTLSSDILKTKSKDLLVGSYFAIAEIRINKLKGLEAGLIVFAGMLELYWDSLFPSKKRMRGRIAAITWLLEKCESAFEEIQLTPVEPDMVIALRAEVQKIDTLLQEYLEDAPLLRPLERILEEIPIKEDVVQQEVSSQIPENKEPPAQPPPPAQSDKPNNPADSADRPEVEGESEPPRSAPVQITPAPSVSTNDTVSAAEMEKIVRGAFHTIKQAADFYFEKDLSNPRGYRCRRIAGWSLIQTIPPSMNSQTQVPPPGEFEDVKKNLQELRSLEKWQELLQESERRLNSSLLWLDLNRLSAECLLGLGAQYQEAHETICQETVFLLTRLPGLDKLTFSDGSPLADAETKQWLDTIAPDSETTLHVPTQQATQSNEHMDNILEQAQLLASAKKVQEAIRLLNDEMQRSPSDRERLLWRLNLSQLLTNYRHAKLAMPHLDEIVKNIESYNLEQWDPGLATHALKIVWTGYKNNKTTKEQADYILARIARLDPVAAMLLNK